MVLASLGVRDNKVENITKRETTVNGILMEVACYMLDNSICLQKDLLYILVSLHFRLWRARLISLFLYHFSPLNKRKLCSVPLVFLEDPFILPLTTAALHT